MSDIEEMVKRLLLPAVFSIFGGIARVVFSGTKCIWCFGRGIILSGFVGLACALGLQGLDIPEGPKGMIIGVAAFCAEEAAMFLVELATAIKKDPLGYATRILSALRGRES